MQKCTSDQNFKAVAQLIKKIRSLGQNQGYHHKILQAIINKWSKFQDCSLTNMKVGH